MLLVSTQVLPALVNIAIVESFHHTTCSNQEIAQLRQLMGHPRVASTSSVFMVCELLFEKSVTEHTN